MPFRAIVGHPRLIALVSRAVNRGTLPPALLFAGPAGVGKRRTATALAQALNCLAPVADSSRDGIRLEIDACGECPACRRIARGVHPDVIVIEPGGDTGTIRIEAIRAVVQQAQYRPFEGRRRVVIIDEADAMVEAAQNALLKTLEEPPPASVFVLVSSLPDSLLATVRSRCPRLRFGALSAGDVAQVLMRDHGYSEGEARAAAADAGGSVGLALSAQSADLAEARELARRLLDQTSRASDPVRRLQLARELTARKGTPAEERERLAACLRAAASLLRDISLLASQADERSLANADLQGVLAKLAATLGLERSQRAFGAVDRALAALQRHASPKVVADWLVLQL